MTIYTGTRLNTEAGPNQGKWEAFIMDGVVREHLSWWSTEREAAAAYNVIVARRRGTKARLNRLRSVLCLFT